MPDARKRKTDAGSSALRYGVYPAVVTSLEDPEKLGRIQISPSRTAGIRAASAWARIATLMAGTNRGTWFLPEAGDVVLIAFEAGDPRLPYIVGSLWNEDRPPPRSLPDDGTNDVRVLRTRSGLELVFDDSEGSERISLETSGGQRIVLDDAASAIDVTDSSGNRIKLEPSGVTIEAPAKMTIRTPALEVAAGSIDLQSASVRCEGSLQAETVTAVSVEAESYSPGAGNLL